MKCFLTLTLEKHPKDQFGNYIAKEKKNFENYGFAINHKRDGEEWWIDYEATKSKIKCNLLDARDNYSEVLIEFEAGNITRAVEKLTLAISPAG